MATITIDLTGDRRIAANLNGGLMRGVVPRIITKTAVAGENEGKKRSPVDTGRLRASMTHRVLGRSGWFGTNVKYGEYLNSPRTRRPHYRAGPFSGQSTAGWFTEKAFRSTEELVPDIIRAEIKGIESRWT